MKKQVQINDIKLLYELIKKMKLEGDIMQNHVNNAISGPWKAVDYFDAMSDLVDSAYLKMNQLWSPELQELKDSAKYYFNTWQSNKTNVEGKKAYKMYQDIKNDIDKIQGKS